MPPLAAELRRDLERAVIAARQTAETGAQNALVVLGVADDRAPDGLTAEDRALRVALRARARSLGSGLTVDGMAALREEIAYGAWHRMLFARFLAENGLLVEPSSGAPVSIPDVAELAQETGEADPWVLAARYAAAMLPGIFGTVDLTNQVAFSPDDRLRLEAILRGLPKEVFTADDALGWVYQFWQSKRKDEVNAAGAKIGGADIAPVTQLFTEHYMVRFLLENSLGAWWAGRHSDSPLLLEWEYLRFCDDGTPAAGDFEGWPVLAAEVTVMDPCMGSGHFLVVAGDMLRRMRMEEEKLTAAQAAVAVMRDNLFGVELDARCLQLAAFNLALDAWKTGGYQPLPIPNLACSGIAIKGQRADWHRLAGGDTNTVEALDRLYDLFQDATELGSLIDPRSAAGEGLWAVDVDDLLARLDRALARETAADPAAAVFGAAAAGTAKAAQLLARRYWLVTTNPPFLGRGAQGTVLLRYLASHHDDARKDLATSILERSERSVSPRGGLALVLPQNWLFLSSYRRLRRRLLQEVTVSAVARLGAGAFETISGEVVQVSLVVVVQRPPVTEGFLIDVGAAPAISDKQERLRTGHLQPLNQEQMLLDPDARIVAEPAVGPRLEDLAKGVHGLGTKDSPQFIRCFWEHPQIPSDWERMQASVARTTPWGGMEHTVHWEQGRGELHRRAARGEAILAGGMAHGRPGVLVSQVGDLAATLYSRGLFEKSAAVVSPADPGHVPAIWAFCSNPAYREAVRRIDQKLAVTNTTLVKVPFDLEHWAKVAAAQYPDGLPKPQTDDPTQWLFKGNVVGSEVPLQVAVARLLGYRWPDQEPDALDAFADPDGIVCLPPVSGEAPAAERLEKLLAAAYCAGWSTAKRSELLAATGGKATTLDAWLRDEFFEQHARLFHNRPFIWQVWDGRKDGFSVLLHYHRLDRATLEKLTYSQLGDWLERQRAGIAAGEAGAEARLAAAAELQSALANILEGEPPYDVYVRWKSLAEQPIGWEPDLDDGVRLNIRPFVAAGILRAKFSINWNKDRGNDPDGSERLNDLHFTVAQKRAARQ
jgi:hypothetical protein